MTSNPSLRAFLTGIIDYAGLFPPASLSLEESIRNYVRYLDEAHPWMLSRFILPTSRMAELAALAEAYFPPDRTLIFSALGRRSDDRKSFFNGLEASLAEIAGFREALGPRAVVDVFECPVPSDELQFQIRADNLAAAAVEQLTGAGLRPFLEAPFTPAWQEDAGRLFAAIRRTRSQAGFKIRTGGVEPQMVPSPAQVAWALRTALDAGVPIKATAGLHHPVRHFDPAVGTKMHGFFNVFGAGLLAQVHGLSEGQMLPILEEENPTCFRFDTDGFAWRALAAGPVAISAFRENQFVSFGSCSFDEPLEDLEELGLL